MENLSIIDIIGYIPGAHEIFEKYGLNYYKDGNRTLRQLCESAGVNVGRLSLDLNDAAKKGEVDISSWDMTRVIAHIINKFHSGEQARLKLIMNLLESSDIDERDDLLRLLHQEKHDLMLHSLKEEKTLFPYILKMEKIEKGAESSSALRFLFHENIFIYEAEHDQTLNHLNLIMTRLSEYYPSQSKEIIESLKDLMVELRLHFHFENNILFPKALQLQQRLKEEYKRMMNIKPLAENPQH